MADTTTYTALGASFVGAVGWFLLRVLRRKGNAEDAGVEVDNRVVKLSSVQDGIIADLRKENDALRGEVRAANESYRGLVDSIQNRIESALARVEETHKASIERVHERLDECERKHAACEEERKVDRADYLERLAAIEKALKPRAVARGGGALK